MSKPQAVTIPPTLNADWFAEADQEIRRLAQKSRGRQIPDFDPILPAVESGSRRWLAVLANANPPAPLIYPTRRGTIQFEWEHGARYFEIEVQGERAAQWYFEDAEAREELSGTIFEDEPLSEVLDRIRLVVETR